MTLKKLFLTGVTAAALGVGGLAASTISASAYVVCNRDGDCWHSEHRDRAPGVRFDYHPDDWYFHQRWEGNRDHRWREHHDGRGYYRGGIWIQL